MYLYLSWCIFNWSIGNIYKYVELKGISRENAKKKYDITEYIEENTWIFKKVPSVYKFPGI